MYIWYDHGAVRSRHTYGARRNGLGCCEPGGEEPDNTHRPMKKCRPSLKIDRIANQNHHEFASSGMLCEKIDYV